MTDVATEIAALDRMNTGDLAERYAELHGQPCRTRHRAYLIRKIAWRIQANAEGDLSERARRRAVELADDAEVRVMAPKTMICPPQDGQSATVTRPAPAGPDLPDGPRLPTPGSALVRLLRDIERGKVDCVIVYKVDRLICPVGCVPAGEMERVVVEEVCGLGKDEALLAQVLADAHAAIDTELAETKRERDALRRERTRHHEELQQLATSGRTSTDVTARIAELHELRTASATVS